MDEFVKLYEEYRGSRPMRLIFKRIETGIPRWRAHVFEEGTAPTGGDMELLFAEDVNREECLKKAAAMLRRRIENEQKAEKKAV